MAEGISPSFIMKRKISNHHLTLVIAVLGWG